MSEPLVPASSQPIRTAACCAAFALVFGVLIWRLHHLQVEEAGRFAALGERQRVRHWTIHASRGSIVDGESQTLVASQPVWNLYADPDYMSDKMTANIELAKILDVDREQLRQELNAKGNGRLVAKHLSELQATQVREMLDGYRKENAGREIGGLTLRRTYRRTYVADDVRAAHVLGFVLDDGSGGAGIELACNRFMVGKNGEETLAVDARGRPLIGDGYLRRAAQDGAHVQVTMVTAVQRELEQALFEAVQHHKASSAAGVVIRPSTGDIVAMASVPDFHPVDFRDADPAAFRNNVLNFVYESGSTMKPLVAGAAVADGVASWTTKINCHQGKWTYRHGRSRRTIHSHPHGVLTVQQGIAKSDNILMAKLGIDLGPERLYRWIRRFGFGAPTGIELPGEDGGVVRPQRLWDTINSCMSIPMGHEMSVTPLQMAAAHAAIANGGVWNPPRIIDRMYHEDPETGQRVDVTDDFQRPRQRRIFSAQDAEQIAEAMRETMRNGTGKRAQIEGWTSAGKTGTTEKLINGRYQKDRHIGSFVCWTPSEPGVRAEYLCLVVVDDPRANGHYGSQTAAPVVQRVLQFAMDRSFGSHLPLAGDDQ